MLARLSSLSLCLLLLFGLFVISHIYPAACGPKGHGSSGEILQVYPKSHPRPTILRETMRPPALNVGLPLLHPLSADCSVVACVREGAAGRPMFGHLPHSSG